MDNMDDLNFDDIDLNDTGSSGFGDMFDDGSSGSDIYGQGTPDPNQMQQNNGSDYFTDDMDDADDITDDQRRMLDKKYIIVIVGGIIIFLLVLFLGSRVLGGKKNNSNEMLDNINQQQQQQVSDKNTNVNVDNIMGNQTQQPVQNNVQQSQQDVNVNYHKDENEFSWMEVTDSENVVFEESYAERIFTITTVKHYARTVDSANNLVMKTTLTGSLSGLPGTYIIEVPYSKGVKLRTGNSFTVNVLMGTYNDKIVVGDITY